MAAGRPSNCNEPRRVGRRGGDHRAGRVEEFDMIPAEAEFAGVLGAVAVVVTVDRVADRSEWLVAEVGGVTAAPGVMVTAVDPSSNAIGIGGLRGRRSGSVDCIDLDDVVALTERLPKLYVPKLFVVVVATTAPVASRRSTSRQGDLVHQYHGCRYRRVGEHRVADRRRRLVAEVGGVDVAPGGRVCVGGGVEGGVGVGGVGGGRGRERGGVRRGPSSQRRQGRRTCSRRSSWWSPW